MVALQTAPKIVNTTPVWQRNASAYEAAKYPIICNEGGSRSSKSYSIIQLLCGIAKREPKKRISIVSHSLPHIKRGAFRDFKGIMQEIGWWKEDQWRATDFVYTFSNGSYIELFGLEDEGKARGPGRDILFVNEANLITKTLFDQLAMRTTGQIFLDWNPADFNSWVYDVADDPKNKRIHSTYKDNIHNLSKAQIDYIESYRDLPDDFMWKVYGLGQRGAAKELIYTNWKYYTEQPPGGESFYGLDFGYTNPSAMVMVTHYEGANYVQEVLYQSALTVPEMINKLKGFVAQNAVIYADAAEPKTIEEIYKAGFNIKPSDKDVWAGIVGVKSYPLFIKQGSDNLVAELQSYKWKKDKNDKVLEEPVKAADHLCFTGDTIVACWGGDRRIDEIEEGDYVLTSKGYKRVNKLFNNGYNKIFEYRIETANFDITVRCTPNHKIKVGNTWKPISQLQQGQTVSLCSTSMANGLHFTKEKDTLMPGQLDCTSTFGNTSMAKYQEATMYITKTGTLLTMNRLTLNLKRLLSTKATILNNGLRKALHGLKSFMQKALQQHQSGTDHQKVLSGTSNTPQSKDLENLPMESTNVMSAWVNLYVENQIKNIAQTIANQDFVEVQEPIQFSGLASTVKSNTTSTSIEKESIAQQAVVLNIVGTYAGKDETYDLNVDEVHEYFANGLLVHNCDATRYAIFTHLTKPVTAWWSA